MTGVTAVSAGEKLRAAIREELCAAFERGKQAQRHWDNTGEEVLADDGASRAFATLMTGVEIYAGLSAAGQLERAFRSEQQRERP